MADLFSIKGRLVLLTGASRGLGRDMALTLAAAGATVLCAGRSVKELEATARAIARRKGKAHVVPLDITDEVIRHSLLAPITQIVAAVRIGLAPTPTELASAIVDQAIALAGRQSLLAQWQPPLRRGAGLSLCPAAGPCTGRGERAGAGAAGARRWSGPGTRAGARTDARVRRAGRS